MLILGIETSCDETGVALYDVERGLLGQVLHSQVALHRPYGGVVPELASRDHIQRLLPLLRKLCTETNVALEHIDAIAYTAGPGLTGALLIGAGFAQGLAFALELPVLPIHHLEAHVLSTLMGARKPKFPFIALLVSGGHTQLLRADAIGSYELLGETLDDAVGEAFDKTAHLLGLGYPGGAALAELATHAPQNYQSKFKLPRPMIHSGDLQLSFSGLKTAVALAARELEAHEYPLLAHEFQEAVTEVLCSKSLAALSLHSCVELVVAGGVGANTRLRERLYTQTAALGMQVYFPDLVLCTDNGAMVAHCAALRWQHGWRGEPAGAFGAMPRWTLGSPATD